MEGLHLLLTLTERCRKGHVGDVHFLLHLLVVRTGQGFESLVVFFCKNVETI